MTKTEEILDELDNLYEDCNYSSLIYFNAAKSADRWSRAIVFLPALVSAISALLVAFGLPKEIGALSALAGAVAATASFIGAGQRSTSLRESAKKFTLLRHKARLEKALAEDLNVTELEVLVRGLRDEYAAIVSTTEPAPDRFYRKARQQMKAGVLEYSSNQDVEVAK